MTTRFDYSDADRNDVLAADWLEETQAMRPSATDESSTLSTPVVSDRPSSILEAPDRHQDSVYDSDQWVAIPAYAGIDDDDDDFDEDDDYLDDDDDDEFGDDFDDDDDEEESYDGGDWEEVDDDDDWDDDDDDDDDDWEDDDVDDWD